MKVSQKERFVATGSLVEKKGNNKECISISWQDCSYFAYLFFLR